MERADFLIIGGGVAGLSAAAGLSRHGRVVLLEAEEALGYHSSGRSVSFSHYGIGNEAVRALTNWSRPFFESPPTGFSPVPLARASSSLYFAWPDALPALEDLHRAMSEFTDAIRVVDASAMAALCPSLRTGDGAAVRGLLDPTGLKLDADAFLQALARRLRAAGGEIRSGWRVTTIDRTGGDWVVHTAGGAVSAPVLINAAGAWADALATMAGVAPLGLQPKRRTIIAVDPPAGAMPSDWPFTHSVAGDFYMLPEAGRILVSPVDEIDDAAGDAQPEDYDIALASDRLEHYTDIKVARIAHRWAGLRTFAPGRVPVAGYAADAPGFFWLVGQGGYGFQTAPAMAAIAESLIAGLDWPEGLRQLGVGPDRILPA